MERSFCVKCKRMTMFKGKPKLGKTKNNRYALFGNCSTCGMKKVRFVGKSDLQKGSGLLSMLGIKTPLASIPIIGDILG